MQDQAFLGLEAALAVPDPGGKGVELHVATQWLHEDRHQIAACLGLPDEAVRLVLGGVGGAFGAREDISLQVHTCLLALRLGRPVRIAYSRAESFLGHVHRHPATIWMRHHATTRRRDRQDRGAHGVRRRGVRLHVVGGADQRHHAHPGPVPLRQRRRRRVRRADEPPAVRGDARVRGRAGVLRPRIADGPAGRRLRARSGRDPPAQRDAHGRPADHRSGRGERGAGRAVHPRHRGAADADGRPADGTTSWRCRAARDAPPIRADIVRGVGWGVAIKNLMYSEGFDDYSTARCRLADGVATLKFATSEVGQGFVTIAGQIARVDPRRRRGRARPDRHAGRLRRVDVGVAADVDERGSGRRRLPGGARAAVRARRRRRTASTRCASRSRAPTSSTSCPAGGMSVAEATRRASRSTRPSSTAIRPTEDLDENGQGNCHTAFAFVAHRAVVDVDPRARPGEGRADGHGAGRRAGAEPAVGAPARSRAASPRASGWP